MSERRFAPGLAGPRRRAEGPALAPLCNPGPLGRGGGCLGPGPFPPAAAPAAWRAGEAALEAGRRAQAALPEVALPLERIRVIAAALAAGDELRLELHPAAVTAAGRALIAGLVDCLPRQGPAAPAGRAIAGRLWAGLSSLDPEPELVGAP